MRVFVMRTVLILGAAGRDFHNFNAFYRNNPNYRVIGFTATQIPGIASRVYPTSLAGEFYPYGIHIFAENDLEKLIKKYKIQECVFSYSDVSHEYVMHIASRCIAGGASFVLLGPQDSMLKSSKKVISVCATRTGAGKSPVTRRITGILRNLGIRFVVVRHPMPYGNLEAEKVERLETLDDLDRYRCTIEEREDYEPHIRNGVVVYAGIDYGEILKNAEKEADVIVWDGGNNDLPFYKPDLHIVVADALRTGHELTYHPGEANFRMADMIIINKTSANPEGAAGIRKNALRYNPHALIIESDLELIPEYRGTLLKLKGKRVLAIEDGPTITHGGMPYGAAYVFCKKAGADILDSRKFAVDSIKKAFELYPHMGNVLPALGYGDKQMHELEKTINRSRADFVVTGTPIDIRRIIQTKIPIIHIRYELKERNENLEKEIKKVCKGIGGSKMADRKKYMGKKVYSCSICKLGYTEKEYAHRCGDFCRKNSMCSMEIAKHAVKTTF